MTPIPDLKRLSQRWRLERVLAWIFPVALAVMGGTILLGLALWFIPAADGVVYSLLAAMFAWWVLAGIVLLARYLRPPSTELVAKRADLILGLNDDLLTLSELPADQAQAWQEATSRSARSRLSTVDLPKVWPLRLSRAAGAALIAGLLLTVGVGWLGMAKLSEERTHLAQQEAAQEARVAAAIEVLEDWKEFVKLTDDEELKKIFTEAAALQEALKDKDPMAAMLEMNRIEEQMAEMKDGIEKQSLDSQASEMAEGLESIEGMSAMSAALRNKNYPEAAAEAEKLEAALAKNPEGQSAVNRSEAMAEMLGAQARTASSKGNQNLSEALSQLSQSASQAGEKGSVPNQQLQNPTKSMKNQFAQESARKNRGRAASLANEQLESLRRKLRGEGESNCPPSPSLCKSLCQGGKPGGKPGGNKAGTGPGGDPLGEKTDLAGAGVQESLTGVQTDGESEKKTISSSDGSGTAVEGGRPAAFSDYVELSQKAVADENLPLAHRKVIQAYFERIRPVAEKP